MKNKNSDNIFIYIVIFAIILVYVFNQGWINLDKFTSQTFAIGVSHLNEGELYYGCKSPISKADCIYYGTNYYISKYVNIKDVGCRDKDWGVECIFTGDKIL